MRIGIYHDLSWTNPMLSIMLRAVYPYSSIMTSCLIFTVGSKAASKFTDVGLLYVMIGAFLYMHFASYAWVPTLAIGEGKNLFVFQYIIITKASSKFYLAGRTFSSFVVSILTATIGFILSYITMGSIVGHFPQLSLGPYSVVSIFAISLLNIPASLGLGYILASYALYASKFEWALPAYIAGMIMILSGALFPVTLLPYPVSFVAQYIPFTEFIRAARDVLLYSNMSDFLLSITTGFAGGLILLLIGYFVYEYSEEKARKVGALDRRLA